MGRYLLRKLLIAVPSLLGISVVLFTVLALAPGDPFGELATNPNVPPEVGAVPLNPGWRLGILRGRTHPDFKALEETSFSLAVGQVSDPVETPVGYVVLKRLPYFRARVRHVLVMHKDSQRKPPNVVRTKEEARARAEEALAKVKADPAAWAKVVADAGIEKQ